MITNNYDIDPLVRSPPGPAWAKAWHLWRVIIPRRSITGRLVWGTVWRRADGRHWIYKKLSGYSGNGDRPE
jgi:hypothetical protein